MVAGMRLDCRLHEREGCQHHVEACPIHPVSLRYKADSLWTQFQTGREIFSRFQVDMDIYICLLVKQKSGAQPVNLLRVGMDEYQVCQSFGSQMTHVC